MKQSSVEFQLLLACLRWPLTETDRKQIRGLLRVGLNSTLFFELVLHHQVVPIVFRNLDDAARAETPGELFLKLRGKAISAGKQTLRRVLETIHLTAELERCGIDARVLKGVALSIQAYRDATLQLSIDIDLLVPLEQVLEAEKVLLQCGYRRTSPLARLTPRRIGWILNHSHHFHFVHAKTRENVELHWGLTANPFKHERLVFERISTTRLRIGSNQIPSLAPEDMFLHACVHGAEHCWSRLKWLAQIGAMIRAMTGEEFRAIMARASQFGVTPELTAAVALVDHYQLADLSAAEIPLEPSLASDRIVKKSLQAIDGGPGYSNNAVVGFRDAWLAASSFNYRRNLVERTIIREESWELIDLPDSLFLGYVLVAPIAWLQHRRAHNHRISRERVLASGKSPGLDLQRREPVRRVQDDDSHIHSSIEKDKPEVHKLDRIP